MWCGLVEVVDEALVAGCCDFRVGMQAATSGMGETRDSGRGAGEVADANRIASVTRPWLLSPTELLGETVRERLVACAGWGGGSGSGLWYDGASISFHRVISRTQPLVLPSCFMRGTKVVLARET